MPKSQPAKVGEVGGLPTDTTPHIDDAALMDQETPTEGDLPEGTPPGTGDENADKKKTKPQKRLNLVRFLQEKPQQSGVRALLNAKHRNSALTLAEWDDALAEILGKKTK